MAIYAKPPGPIRIPDAAAPMGLVQSCLADTTNATCYGGIDVPHRCLSAAKIDINTETSKQFPKFNIKQRDAGHENLRPLCIELLQELCANFDKFKEIWRTVHVCIWIFFFKIF